MKFSRYISVFLLALASSVAFTSCDGKDEPGYKPSDPTVSGRRVFFASPVVQINVGDDANSAVVKVYRPQDDSKSALTVQILSTDPSGLFRIPSSVRFDAGQVSADITVGFVNSALVPNMNYEINLAVNEANANEYAIASTTAIICHSVWTEWEPFGYDESLGRDSQGYYVYSLLFNEPETVKPVRVMSRINPLDSDQMQFEAQVPVDADDLTKGWETFLTFASADGGRTLSVPSQEAMEGPDGMIYVEDLFSYTGSPSYKGLSTFDPVSGLFKFNVVYYDEVGVWNYGFEILQLNGYADTNVYTLEVTDRGAVKIDDKDYQIINFSFNANIAFVNYTLVAGLIDDEQIAGVAAAISNPDDETYQVSTIATPGNVSLTFPRGGDYTVVAVGFTQKADGSVEPKATASATFTFETFDPDLGWETVTDSGTMAENLINSLLQTELPDVETQVRIDKSTEFEGLYRINRPYANYVYLDALAESGLTLSNDFAAIIINASNSDEIYVEPSFTGLMFGGSPLWIESTAALYLEHGAHPSAEYFGLRTDSGFEFKAMDMATESDDPSFLASLDGTNFGYVANMSLKVDFASARALSVPRATGRINLGHHVAFSRKAPARITYKALDAKPASGSFVVRTLPVFIY